MEFLWVIVFAIFLLVEILTINLVTIWFALSALIVFIIRGLIPSLSLQILVFSILGLIFIIFTLPIVRKYIKNKTEMQKFGTVVEIKDNMYLVKYKGVLWEAESKKEYKLGDRVEIKKFNGNKIII